MAYHLSLASGNFELQPDNSRPQNRGCWRRFILNSKKAQICFVGIPYFRKHKVVHRGCLPYWFIGKSEALDE